MPGNRTTPPDNTSLANAAAITVDTPTGVSITSGGTQLASNDDSDGGRNFKIKYTLNVGTSTS